MYRYKSYKHDLHKPAQTLCSGGEYYKLGSQQFWKPLGTDNFFLLFGQFLQLKLIKKSTKVKISVCIGKLSYVEKNIKLTTYRNNW